MTFWIKTAEAIAPSIPSEAKRCMTVGTAREEAMFRCAELWNTLTPDERQALTGAVLAVCKPDPILNTIGSA